jgi:uncharacterized protein
VTIDFFHTLWVATALMLVIEGLMPFINPTVFRRALLQMATMKDQQLRLIGLFSMIVGVVLLYWIN